jgi:hypothetical protein
LEPHFVSFGTNQYFHKNHYFKMLGLKKSIYGRM